MRLAFTSYCFQLLYANYIRHRILTKHTVLLGTYTHIYISAYALLIFLIMFYCSCPAYFHLHIYLQLN